MKATKQIVHITARLVCLMVLVTVSFAANPTLVLPRGLAVDGKGNLYVANSAANDILVYNSAYVLQPSKTISMGISTPWGLAYDRWGNLWVANNGNNSVTEYPNGQLSPAATPTTLVSCPQALAFDPLGDLWVQDNGAYLSVYGPLSGTPLGAPASEVQTVTPGGTVYGVAFGTDAIANGTPTDVVVGSSGPTILFGELGGFLTVSESTGFAMASDVSGRFYIANLDGSVQISATKQGVNGQPGSLNTSLFLRLPFAPSGIAIDNDARTDLFFQLQQQLNFRLRHSRDSFARDSVAVESSLLLADGHSSPVRHFSWRKSSSSTDR